MIAPGQVEGGRAGGIAAAPVTEPPFAPLGGFQIPEDSAAEADRREPREGIGRGFDLAALAPAAAIGRSHLAGSNSAAVVAGTTPAPARRRGRGWEVGRAHGCTHA